MKPITTRCESPSFFEIASAEKQLVAARHYIWTFQKVVKESPDVLHNVVEDFTRCGLPRGEVTLHVVPLPSICKPMKDQRQCNAATYSTSCPAERGAIYAERARCPALNPLGQSSEQERLPSRQSHGYAATPHL